MKGPSQAGNLVGNSIMYTFAQCNIVQSVMYVSVFEYFCHENITYICKAKI